MTREQIEQVVKQHVGVSVRDIEPNTITVIGRNVMEALVTDLLALQPQPDRAELQHILYRHASILGSTSEWVRTLADAIVVWATTPTSAAPKWCNHLEYTPVAQGQPYYFDHIRFEAVPSPILAKMTFCPYCGAEKPTRSAA